MKIALILAIPAVLSCGNEQDVHTNIEIKEINPMAIAIQDSLDLNEFNKCAGSLLLD
ncbi:MAG: hypothetical protein AAF487_03700 [Bacteroidota bacterium]